MPMLVIEGTYRVTGAGPDGDSVRFYPADPNHWDLIPGPHRVRRNRAGGAQLRLDGIDALETHYTPPHGTRLHQPAPFADEAADALLAWLGFTGVLRDDDRRVTAAEPAQVPGYILSRAADVYGRCVAFAGRGVAPAPSGRPYFVDTELIRQTANHRQLEQGLAYPTFYRRLYVGLRRALSAAAVSAREAGLGLWPSDLTASGAKIEGTGSLTDGAVLMPKLFRRLADYLALGDGDPSLAAFRAFLDQRDDRLTVLSTGQFTELSTVVEVSDQTVRMTRPPEDVVFDEK
ncbi:nuclease [Streptomyces sp. NPDC051940]|uniref:nuclease n=1 Tax=Streptomyces sp. NPDC051940 TaxID=3155675 RepID=UPI0034193009